MEAIARLPTSIDDESDALADYDQSDCEYGTEVCSEAEFMEDEQDDSS